MKFLAIIFVFLRHYLDTDKQTLMTTQNVYYFVGVCQLTQKPLDVLQL